MKTDVKQALELTKNQIALSAEIAAEEINDWQVIQNYITNRIATITLTEKQQEKLRRYEFAYNQFVSGKYMQHEVVEMLQETFGISYPQALRDVKDSREIFTTSINVNKLFEIKIQLEINRLMLKKAEEMNDLKAYAQLEKNRQKFIAMLPDDESSLADEFIPRQNILEYNPELIGVKIQDINEIRALASELKRKYGGVINIAGKDITEAEVVNE